MIFLIWISLFLSLSEILGSGENRIVYGFMYLCIYIKF
jgi:hypothetical protein